MATINDLLDAYLDDAELVRKVASPKSLRSHAKHLRIHFGALEVEDFAKGVKRRAVAFADHRREVDGVGDSTINREIRNLAAALNFAEREELIERNHNVAKRLVKPAQAEPRDRVLSHHEGGELDRFTGALDAAPKHYARFARIALLTGQRKTAILELERRHVDFERGVLWFSRTQAKKTKKRRQDQPINDALRAVLDECLADMAPGCERLIQWRGRPVRDVRGAHKSVCARAGISERLTIHDLRRTAAQTVRDELDDLSAAAGLIGDTEATTGRTYARAKVSRNLKAMDVMAAKLRRGKPPAIAA